jgi:UDP-N-acetylglucosamine 2-epimerase
MDAGSDGISKGIRMYREKSKSDFVHFFKGLPIEEFACLLKNSRCIVGNSSSGLREAAFLGVPCVNVGTRQAGRERGKNVTDVGYNSEEIKKAITKQLESGHYKQDMIYGDGNAGRKIAEVLSTYDFRVQKRIVY